MVSFKVGDRVFTRDGREVEILKIDAPGRLPIIGMMVMDGFPHLLMFHADGKHTGSRYDLLPPKRTREVTVWVNVYPSHEGLYTHESLARLSAEHGGGPVLAVAVPHTFTLEY